MVLILRTEKEKKEKKEKRKREYRGTEKEQTATRDWMGCEKEVRATANIGLHGYHLLLLTCYCFRMNASNDIITCCMDFTLTLTSIPVYRP